MEIKVIRDEFTDSSTIGQLSIDGAWQCWTLELATPKSYPGVKGINCVPLGKYKLEMSMYHGEVYEWMVKIVPSIAQFGLPKISNIEGVSYPNWTNTKDGIPTEGINAQRNVYIHIGNTKNDTLGCLLVGLKKSKDRIDQSCDAFNKIYPQIIQRVQIGEPITIEYVNA